MVALAVVSLIGLTFVVPARFVVLSIPLAFIFGIGVVLLYLRRARKKRLALFQEQLPDAIDLIIRSLKVGHPLSGALSVIARELAAPISTEFSAVFQEVSYGQDIPTALANMAKRVPVPDLQYMVMAVQIQQESGGNLVESLSKLCGVIRDRYRMFRKVKALTVEGRFSAWFLSLFPVVIIFGIQAVKPDFYTKVMDFRFFPHLVVLTVILLLVNVIAMRIVTTIKV
jgi:tight adherence protein B